MCASGREPRRQPQQPVWRQRSAPHLRQGAEATIREWLHDEQWSEEERARIVLLQWGHVHVKGLFWYGNMMLLGPGCFEAQTDYEAERGLYPDLGGAVVEVTMTG